jgi:hypothetical protein
MLLAVQDRRGRASRVRSADGAAMFDGSQECGRKARLVRIRSTGVACAEWNSSHRP